MLTHVCFTAVRHMPRFFPYFVGLVRFLREREDNEVVMRVLEQAVSLQEKQNRSDAFTLAMKKEYRRALELAMLD
jgi:hypothetical protein